MRPSRPGQLSLNIPPLGKAVRSSGSNPDLATGPQSAAGRSPLVPLPTRDADDPRPPSAIRYRARDAWPASPSPPDWWPRSPPPGRYPWPSPPTRHPSPPTPASSPHPPSSAPTTPTSLAEAKADGDKNVTMMIATAPGQTEQVAQELDAVQGGSVGRTYDKLGYVRATVPTGRADAAIAAAAKLSSVHGIDLRQEIPLDDPSPSRGHRQGRRQQGHRGHLPGARARTPPPRTRTTRPSRRAPSTS